ncbi:MAG TPA: 1-acyl-sn-glycerol-3-phosphate acyltransferase [Trichocoleus sp.]|jgi:1-acyl-sn-glycerol-3-phosphate acyltransferase
MVSLHSPNDRSVHHAFTKPVSAESNLARPNPPKAAASETPITAIRSRLSPWLTPIAYRLGCWFVLPSYFRHIEVTGRANLPQEGPLILAPTHRSRWDAMLIPYVAGRCATGRDIRFMVTVDEVKGIQGWLIQQLGGFPVNPRQPAVASLRYGVEVLQNRETLVIFPEGGIFRDRQVHPLKPGLARLALQAEASQPGLDVKIVPIDLSYSEPFPQWRCRAKVAIGQPLAVAQYREGSVKQRAQQLTDDLELALRQLILPAAETPADPHSVSANVGS